MEYKIFQYLRDKLVIPTIIRVFFGVIMILLSIIPIILPIFPGSFVFGILMLVIGLLLFVSAKKIKHVIKLRKGITYLFQNILQKHIIKHKIYDIKKHIMDILNERKNRKKDSGAI